MPEAAVTRLPVTRLEIDLDAIRSNLRTIRRMAGGRKVVGVIKADAYGHGALAIAQTLANEGVDYLAAGSIDEAVSVRGAGVAAPILVLGSLAPDAAAEVVRHRLIASIDDTPGADALERAAGTPQPVWIKVDCGFGRYGVPLPEAEAFIRALAKRPRLKLEGIYTHLPFSDAEGRAWAARQTAAFRDLLATLERAAIRFPVVQATASPGLLCGFGDHTAVATGHLLYGLNPFRSDGGADVDASAFRPALRRIVTRLVHRTHRLHGEAAATYLRHSSGPLGIVPIGLAHGYRPAVGDAFMLVRGAIAPVLRVTLESTILDLAEVPNYEVGEPVTALGRDGDCEISARALADWHSCGVLPMLMGLGRAVPRVYAGQHE